MEYWQESQLDLTIIITIVMILVILLTADMNLGFNLAIEFGYNLSAILALF